MSVNDVIYYKVKGHIILGSKKYNRDENSIYVGKKDGRILVGTDSLKYEFEVKDISISIAFIGDIVIGILIHDSEDIDRIKIGDKVYAIIEDE